VRFTEAILVKRELLKSALEHFKKNDLTLKSYAQLSDFAGVEYKVWSLMSYGDIKEEAELYKINSAYLDTESRLHKALDEIIAEGKGKPSKITFRAVARKAGLSIGACSRNYPSVRKRMDSSGYTTDKPYNGERYKRVPKLKLVPEPAPTHSLPDDKEPEALMIQTLRDRMKAMSWRDFMEYRA
jgi:hypothetical protein